jgi:hypothetical protein
VRLWSSLRTEIVLKVIVMTVRSRSSPAAFKILGSRLGNGSGSDR